MDTVIRLINQSFLKANFMSWAVSGKSSRYWWPEKKIIFLSGEVFEIV